MVMIPLCVAMFMVMIFKMKHLLADYFLQNAWMLGKFKPGWDFVIPLSAHCGVHAAFTMAICSAYEHFLFGFWGIHWGFILKLMILDFVVHFIMDRIKASPELLGRFEAISKNEYREIVNMTYEDKTTGEIVRMLRTNRNRLKSNIYFWWCLGVDQFVHGITDVSIVWLLLEKVS